IESQQLGNSAQGSPMSICVACPSCREKLVFLDRAAGTVVGCPGCRAQMRLPAPLPQAIPLRQPQRQAEPEPSDAADRAAGSGINAGRGPVLVLLAGFLVVPLMCCGIVGVGGPSKPAPVLRHAAPPPPPAAQVTTPPARNDSGDFSEPPVSLSPGSPTASHVSGYSHF